jgi:peroxiredoxin
MHPTEMLNVGDQAPAFSGQAQDGRTISLERLRGKWVVVYFYPKAFTPGCNMETRLFRDNYAELQSLGAEVVGVSVDDYETQCRFAGKNEVTFPLLSDASKTISRDYGVLWPLLGKDKRVTYVIDPKGVVRAVFRHEFQVSRHLDDVRTFLEKNARS